MIEPGALLPEPAALAAFAGAVFVLNATPGADLLLTFARTVSRGPRAGVLAALGVNAGCVLHALAAAFGLAGLLALHPSAFRALQWAGAAYLAWLGWGLLRQAGRPATVAVPAGAAASPTAPSAWTEFRTGLLTNVLNPKVGLFFLAFLPQFVPAASPDKTGSFLLLGGMFVAQSTLFLLAVVALAARASHWQTPAFVQRVLAAVGGAVFLVLALRLLGARPASS